jgi:hypothetical protein
MFNLADYETVEERLIKFWEEYPDGRIFTQLAESTGDVFIFVAELYRTENDAKPWATGWARESISDRGVNSTSALENSETSALGRALSNAGYAKLGKRPSREEMSKVLAVESSRDQILKITGELAESDITELQKPADRAPVSLSDAVQIISDRISNSPVYAESCKHGEMIKKEGNKNGRDYFGFTCVEKNGCPAIWYRQDPVTREWAK